MSATLKTYFFAPEEQYVYSFIRLDNSAPEERYVILPHIAFSSEACGNLFVPNP